MHSSRRLRVFLVLLVAIAVTVAAFAITLSSLSQAEPTATPSGTAVSGTSASAPAASGSAAGSAPGSPVPSGAASSSPRNVDPPLPSLVGSIGDSIGVAFDVMPNALGPNPTHEWTFGTAPDDGIYSLLERFRALGADPAIADGARAGARMRDAERQAGLIDAAAQKLGSGQTAFVTLELGANDACAGTDPAVFERQLRAAVDVLRKGTTVDGKRVPGLPVGSRLLVLSVPDVGHLRELTKDVPAAQEVYRLVGLCPSFLGGRATAASVAAGEARITAYNASLLRVCESIEATEGAAGTLHCRADGAGGGSHSMFAAQFTLADISTLDYFHPSLTGQAKIADGAWAAAYWAGIPLPAAPSAGPSASPSAPLTLRNRAGDGG